MKVKFNDKEYILFKFISESEFIYQQRINFIQNKLTKLSWKEAEKLSKIWYNIKWKKCKYNPKIYYMLQKYDKEL